MTHRREATQWCDGKVGQVETILLSAGPRSQKKQGGLNLDSWSMANETEY